MSSNDMSSEARRRLLGAVTDLFLLDKDPTENAKEHYGEIANQSLPHLDGDERRSYAGRVAAEPTLPKTVAVTLASDQDADVARLVLKLSPVLSDSDLAAIAMSHSQAHLVAIAERDRLSEGLTEILVERGDRQVLQTVSGNEGAQFSERGFDRLLERGGQDAGVSQALARRSDLAPRRAERVLRIVEQMTHEGGASLARQARQQRLDLKLLLADLRDHSRTLDEVVIILTEQQRGYHLSQVLAQAAELSDDQALRVLFQRDASGVAVMARVLRIGREAFRSILTLRATRLLLLPQDIEDDLRDYEALDLQTAERAMRFLKLKTKVG